MEFTHNNRIIWGFKNKSTTKTFTFHEEKEDIFYFEVSPIQWQPRSFEDECINTAKLIGQACPKGEQIFLLLSGGLDSEIVVRSFAKAKVNALAIIHQFKNDLNLFEVLSAIRICNAYDIPCKIIDGFCLESFLFSDQVYELAEKYQCPSLPILPTLTLIEKLDGLIVTGAGDLNLKKRDLHRIKEASDRHLMGFDLGKEDPYTFYGQEDLDPKSSEWDVWTSEGYECAYYKAGIKNNKQVFNFFSYTPEIIYAYLKIPMVQKLVNNQLPKLGYRRLQGKAMSYKYHLLQSEFKNLIGCSGNGLESLRDNYNIQREHIAQIIERFPYVNAIHRYPVNRMLNNLLDEH